MSGGDTWKGAAKVSNEVGVRARSFQVLLKFFLAYTLGVFILLSMMFNNKINTDNSIAWVYAKYLTSTSLPLAKSLNIYTLDGRKKSLSSADVLVNKDVISARNSFISSTSFLLIISIILSLFLVKYTRKFFLSFIVNTEDSKKLIRGGEKVKAEELTQLLTEKGIASPYHIGELPIRLDAETQHIFISGAVGGGKGNAIKSLLDDIISENKRFFIYDKSGEYITKYYRSGYDIILNPFDDRMPFWSPWLEAESVFDFEHLATSFVPDSENEKEHWVQAPRTVLADLFGVLDQKKQKNVEVLFQSFQDKTKLYDLLKETSSANVIDPDGAEHAASVLGVLAPKIKSLRLLAQIKNEAFSLREWVQNEDDDRRVFIVANERQLQSIKPLITAWIDIIISEMISLPENRQRRLFGIVDELASLNAINSIKTGIFEGRKFGLCLVLSVTSIEILRSVYGQKIAAAMIAMCNTKVSFRCDESDVAKWLADLYYEEDLYESKEATTIAENHDSFNTHEDRQKRHLLLPTEFMQLDDKQAFIKLGGSLPITQVEVPYVERHTIADSLVKREFNFYKQAQKKTEVKTKEKERNLTDSELSEALIDDDDYTSEVVAVEKNSGSVKKPLL